VNEHGLRNERLRNKEDDEENDEEGNFEEKIGSLLIIEEGSFFS